MAVFVGVWNQSFSRHKKKTAAVGWEPGGPLPWPGSSPQCLAARL